MINLSVGQLAVLSLVVQCKREGKGAIRESYLRSYCSHSEMVGLFNQELVEYNPAQFKWAEPEFVRPTRDGEALIKAIIFEVNKQV